MKLSTLSPKVIQRLAIFTPMAALFLSVFVLYPAWGRYGELRAANEKSQAQLDALKGRTVPPEGRQKPAVADASTEAPQFLSHMAAIAGSAGCLIARFEALPPEKAPEKAPEETKQGDAKAAGSKDAAKPEEEPVKALRAKVEFDSPYPVIRNFLAKLKEADRLYVVVGVDIAIPNSTNNQPGTVSGGRPRSVVTIERYVTNAVAQKTAQLSQ